MRTETRVHDEDLDANDDGNFVNAVGPPTVSGEDAIFLAIVVSCAMHPYMCQDIVNLRREITINGGNIFSVRLSCLASYAFNC